MKHQHIDINKHPPTLSAGVSRAWLQDMKAALTLQGDKPHAGLGGWVVFAPWAHPWWSYYHIYLVHLRDVPGMPLARKHFLEATHEIGVMALDPERMPDLVNPLSTRLEPMNVVVQFNTATDIDAIERLNTVVKDILHQTLNPDTDYRWQWLARFPVVAR